MPRCLASSSERPQRGTDDGSDQHARPASDHDEVVIEPPRKTTAAEVPGGGAATHPHPTIHLAFTPSSRSSLPCCSGATPCAEPAPPPTHRPSKPSRCWSRNGSSHASRGRDTPRYTRDKQAMERLADRLACLGLAPVATPAGLVIEDLCLGTRYFYGAVTASGRSSASRAGSLLARAALFALASWADIHQRTNAARARQPRMARSARPQLKVA